MRAATALAAIALVLGLGPVAVSFADGAPSADRSADRDAKPKLRLKIVYPRQNSILAKGLRVRVTAGAAGKRRGRAWRVRLRAGSSTFDTEAFVPIAEPRALKIREGGRRTTRLPLTAIGAAKVAGCEARTLRARVRGRTASRDLVRTGSCAPQPLDLSRAADCDFVGQQDGSHCLLPFPDDYYTVADPTSATGRRIDLHAAAMPDNAAGKPIDPGPYSHNDGFSPGETILVRVPGLDNPEALAATDPPPIDRIGRYAEADAPVVVIDAETGERLPIWVEIDSNASGPDSTLLEVHPARNYESGHRYIVAMRRLRTGDGSVIPAPEGFRYYRDALPSAEPEIDARRDHFERIFMRLRDAGIRRSNLYLAWDFTVASDDNIAARALHMRNSAFGLLGDDDMGDGSVAGDAPSFAVTATDVPADPQIARRVTGTFTVPCYLVPSCDPGGRFELDADGLPVRDGNYTANFICIIPQRAVGAPGPDLVRPAIYGHGLFGGAGEVYGSSTNRDLADQYGFVICATDEIGMSGADVPNTVANILTDLSNFPQLADRLQQGLLNELFLSRLMIHPDGFGSDPAFHQDGTLGTPSVIDSTQNYYVGASQGGIMGGALTALAPDFTRAVLNVPAMNYSVLLPRSVDYDAFAIFINQQYSEIERPLALALIQMLWDRGEPNGYAHRMTSDPLPETPAHQVLMNVAFGDHQVTNFQADVQARTIGARTRAPVLYPGRWPGVAALWNVPRIKSFPYDGSAIIYGDIGPVRPDPTDSSNSIGVPPPPLTNVPNRQGEDPHGAPRGAPQAVQLMSDFLKPDGAVTNVCGTTACFAGGFTGP
jgi:hypothetical protein